MGRWIALGVFALGLSLGPAAYAQTSPSSTTSTTSTTEPPPEWNGSVYTSPATTGIRLDRDTFQVAGRFQFRKPFTPSSWRIDKVQLAIGPDDDYELGPDCTTPDATTYQREGYSYGEASNETDAFQFSAPDVTLNCNGRYRIDATATAKADTGQPQSYTMTTIVLVEAPGPGVEEVSASTEGSTGEITVEWTPLTGDDVAPDATGYVVERAGPEDHTEDPASFEDVTTVGTDVTSFVDEAEPGEYRYRVRTLRAGPEGPVRSSAADAPTATVTVEPPPTTTTISTTSTTRVRAGTATTAPTTAGPRVGGAIPRPSVRSTPKTSPPTTADTGFDEELDYGDRTPTDDSTVELAGEDPLTGQSIVRTEGDGVGLLVPGAAALVLLGWAGHFVYLNRLAKQL